MNRTTTSEARRDQRGWLQLFLTAVIAVCSVTSLVCKRESAPPKPALSEPAADKMQQGTQPTVKGSRSHAE